MLNVTNIFLKEYGANIWDRALSSRLFRNSLENDDYKSFHKSLHMLFTPFIRPI